MLSARALPSVEDRVPIGKIRHRWPRLTRLSLPCSGSCGCWRLSRCRCSRCVLIRCVEAGFGIHTVLSCATPPLPTVCSGCQEYSHALLRYIAHCASYIITKYFCMCGFGTSFHIILYFSPSLNCLPLRCYRWICRCCRRRCRSSRRSCCRFGRKCWYDNAPSCSYFVDVLTCTCVGPNVLALHKTLFAFLRSRRRRCW